MTAHPSWLRPAEALLTRLVQTLAVLASVVMVASMLIGVFFRYVLQDSLSWTDEIALLSFSWMVFLTAALAVRDNGHVRVQVIDAWLPGAAGRLLWLAIRLAVALVGLYMAWTGLQFVALTAGQTSPAVRYPLWLRDSALPVSGVLIALYALLGMPRPAPPAGEGQPS